MSKCQVDHHYAIINTHVFISTSFLFRYFFTIIVTSFVHNVCFVAFVVLAVLVNRAACLNRN